MNGKILTITNPNGKVECLSHDDAAAEILRLRLALSTTQAELAEARKVIAQTSAGYEKLLREWMYAPFPHEAQVLGEMSPPCGPFAKAAEDIARASEFIRRAEGK